MNSFITNTTWLLQEAFLYTLCITMFLLLHILCGPIWLLLVVFQAGVVAASKWVDGIHKPLSTSDVFFLENYNERHCWSTVSTAAFPADISAKAIQELFVKKVLQAKVKDTQKSKFPKLTQYQTSFLGFQFWKESPGFRIENHIHEVFCDAKDSPEFVQTYESMIAELTGRPYPRQQSPWEMWILRNFFEEGSSQTVFIWRAHHSLMDGFSILSLNTDLFGNSNPAIHVPQAKILKEKELLKWNILSVIRGVREYSAMMFFRNRKFKAWSLAERRKANSAPIENKTHFKFSRRLSLEHVKQVAARLGVRVPALLSTLVAEGMSMVVQTEPEDASALFVCPLPNHPGTLENHAGLASLRFPLSNTQPMTTKLNSINESFLNLKSNPVILIFYYLTLLLGKCPPPIFHFVLNRILYSPMLITNFAGGWQEHQCEGVKCLKVSASVGIPLNIDSLAAIVGYRNEVQILFACHDSLFCEQDAERIASGIEDNFRKLCASP